MSIQSTSTAAYRTDHITPSVWHTELPASPSSNRKQDPITGKGLNPVQIASSSYISTKMANINTVDINHLKKGEVNLGVSACAPRTSHRHFCNAFSYRSCSSQLTPLSQTSIMAVQFNGGVVIGADTRTTTGSYIVSSALKMSRLKGPNRADVCFLRYSLSYCTP